MFTNFYDKSKMTSPNSIARSHFVNFIGGAGSTLNDEETNLNAETQTWQAATNTKRQNIILGKLETKQEVDVSARVCFSVNEKEQFYQMLYESKCF